MSPTSDEQQLLQKLEKQTQEAKYRFIGACVLLLIALLTLPFVLSSPPRPAPALSVRIDKGEAADTSTQTDTTASTTATPASASASASPPPRLPPSPPAATSATPPAAAPSVAGSALPGEGSQGTKPPPAASPQDTHARSAAAAATTGREGKLPPLTFADGLQPHTPAPGTHAPQESPPRQSGAAAVAPVKSPKDKSAATGGAALSAQDARAKALLEGKSVPPVTAAAPSARGRYVVQAGTFADTSRLAAARTRLSNAGIEHYVEEITNSKGEPRTRVRVGGFSSEAQAQVAVQRIRALGMEARLLRL